MPKDRTRHGKGGKQWKPDPLPKLPDTKCPKCGRQTLIVTINHYYKSVVAKCPCFGQLVLEHIGPSSESIDYWDQISAHNIQAQLNKPPKRSSLELSTVQSEKIRQFIASNRTATDPQIASVFSVQVEEIKRIRQQLV